jgi:ubiquinone/menaquinone biosynthesis C-methylase UbiE
MKRKIIPELFDTDQGSSAEVLSALCDLRHINRWFGGNATTALLLTNLAKRSGSQSLSILEVAAGAGDVPRTVQQKLASKGIALQFTLLDRIGAHLGTGNSKPEASQRAIVADALCLPFATSSFDVIHCCLFAHHLAPQQLIHFVNEALRVCRTAVLINDLIRSPLHLALVYAGLPLFRSRITWHDAPASVRQAYTQKEMHEILKQSAASKVDIRPHYLFRMGVTVWK